MRKPKSGSSEISSFYTLISEVTFHDFCQNGRELGISEVVLEVATTQTQQVLKGKP